MVQVTVAELLVTLDCTALITGAGVPLPMVTMPLPSGPLLVRGVKVPSPFDFCTVVTAGP